MADPPSGNGVTNGTSAFTFTPAVAHSPLPSVAVMVTLGLEPAAQLAAPLTVEPPLSV